ncbi:MAG: hypothetical protein HKN79_12680 [Flavobacteriales bacterium]|nr:hypothetical protein [Flavobacteriales bacterium]
MSEFNTFFQIGLDHILDIGAYDHLLFIVSLLIVYRLKDFTEIIKVLTAFTLGHAISVAAGALRFTPLSEAWVEFLIPLSILIMAIYHMIWGKGRRAVVYVITTLFGIIHGLAYAREFLVMMQDAGEILMPLLAFNLGVEVAQIGIGLLFLVLMELLTRATIVERKALHMFIFGVIMTLSIQLLIAHAIW